jgi:hypothetical protein
MISLKDYLIAEACLIQKEKDGGWSVSCGVCSESHLMEDAIDWNHALETSKEAGWQPHQINGAWTSICPACQEREAEALKKAQTAAR